MWPLALICSLMRGQWAQSTFMPTRRKLQTKGIDLVKQKLWLCLLAYFDFCCGQFAWCQLAVVFLLNWGQAFGILLLFLHELPHRHCSASSGRRSILWTEELVSFEAYYKHSYSYCAYNHWRFDFFRHVILRQKHYPVRPKSEDQALSMTGLRQLLVRLRKLVIFRRKVLEVSLAIV